MVTAFSMPPHTVKVFVPLTSPSLEALLFQCVIRKSPCRLRGQQFNNPPDPSRHQQRDPGLGHRAPFPPRRLLHRPVHRRRGSGQQRRASALHHLRKSGPEPGPSHRRCQAPRPEVPAGRRAPAPGPDQRRQVGGRDPKRRDRTARPRATVGTKHPVRGAGHRRGPRDLAQGRPDRVRRRREPGGAGARRPRRGRRALLDRRPARPRAVSRSRPTVGRPTHPEGTACSSSGTSWETASSSVPCTSLPSPTRRATSTHASPRTGAPRPTSSTGATSPSRSSSSTWAPAHGRDAARPCTRRPTTSTWPGTRAAR